MTAPAPTPPPVIDAGQVVQLRRERDLARDAYVAATEESDRCTSLDDFLGYQLARVHELACLDRLSGANRQLSKLLNQNDPD